MLFVGDLLLKAASPVFDAADVEDDIFTRNFKVAKALCADERRAITQISERNELLLVLATFARVDEFMHCSMGHRARTQLTVIMTDGY